MRTTIDLDDALHEQALRRAKREGLSLSRMLGKLVSSALNQPAQAPTPPAMRRSGRFQVIAPAAAGARTASSAVQKVLDEEGIL